MVEQEGACCCGGADSGRCISPGFMSGAPRGTLGKQRRLTTVEITSTCEAALPPACQKAADTAVTLPQLSGKELRRKARERAIGTLNTVAMARCTLTCSAIVN